MALNLRLTYEGKQLEVDPSVSLTIGRSPTCDVVLQNRRVSATHGSVHSDSGGWIYTDTGSRNGSWRGDRRVTGPYRVDGTVTLRLGSPEEFAELGLAAVREVPQTAGATHPFLNQKRMGFAWLATGLLVTLLVGGVTDWTKYVEAAFSVNESLLAFVAGYTLPLTAGVFLALSLFLYNRRNGSEISPIGMAIAVAIILLASGLVAGYLGLGRVPSFTYNSYGPPYISLPLMAVQGYVNAYGWPLALSSAAIGATAALQTDLWRSNARFSVQGRLGA